MLADEPGLGKSAQAIVAAEDLGARSILVVCPGILRINWAREFGKFGRDALPIIVIDNKADLAGLPAYGRFITSYDSTLDPQVRAFLHSRQWDVAILDEAHLLKEPEALRTIAAYGRYADGSGYVANAAACWRITATPTPNNPGELYTFVRSTGLWIAGQQAFMDRYCETRAGRYKIKVVGSRNEAELRQAIAPHVLQRTLADVGIDLPPLRIGEVFVQPQDIDPGVLILNLLREAEPEAARRIERALAEDDWSFEDDPYIARVRRLIGLAKVKSIAERVEFELEQLHVPKIVIFGIHRDFLKYLQVLLHKYQPDILYGGTSDKKRQIFIDRFQENWKYRVLLCQMNVAGLGLTLTAAWRLIVGERSWTPGWNVQAIKRAHRIGQRRSVYADFVTLAGTVDEMVNSALLRKESMIQGLFR